MSQSHVTKFGLPGIGVVPYGLHMCHFFMSRQELVDGLIPYFNAGLENKERCIWIASSPLPADEIRAEIAISPNLLRGVASGQLTILNSLEWYGEPDTLDSDQVVHRWLEEEQRALGDGFEGLRISGNTTFIPRGNWSRLMEYENKLHERLKDRCIVSCCSYHREQCGPVDMLEVVRCHHGALDHTDQHWELYMEPPNKVDGSLESA